MAKLVLTGDINLMKVSDPAAPFAAVASELRGADMTFSNLECCFYKPPAAHSVRNEGFFADPATAKALPLAGIKAVGIANNVHYGEAAILSSIAKLDELGIPHTGAGADLAAASAPIVLTHNGLRYGFLQRSSVYWPTNHEAQDDAAGIAVIRGHTAYHVPAFKTRVSMPPPNRPGVPPDIITWADAAYLSRFRADVAALRQQADIVVASCHWGLGKEVLQYMREIAHAAIDAGADIVAGHGPHFSLPVEVYRGRPVFYGLGSFSFHTGHGGRRHDDWIGMMAQCEVTAGGVTGAWFRLVRRADGNRTEFCDLAQETGTIAELETASRQLGAALTIRDQEIHIALA